MAQDFKAKILASRERWVDACGYRFLIRRMADIPLARLWANTKGSGDFSIELVLRQVVGWDGITEAVLAPGGGDEPVPFDEELFRLWVEDRGDVFNALFDAVSAENQRHREAKEEAGNG